jgi:hypothetical protein
MSKLFESGYALLAGAGGDLPDTVDDALGLAKIFQDEGRCAFPPAQVYVLGGEQARRKDILDALDRLAHTGEQDTVVVYFSGHGYRVSHPALGGQYYLMPFGYNVDDLPGTAISGNELAGKLAAIPAQKLLLLLDCCHAGGVGEAKAAGLQFAKAPLPAEVLPRLQAGRGRVLIASSKEDELSYAGKPYSAFTLALIEALCGKGASMKDGYVRVADLALHARQMVPRRTADKQHPVLHFEGADNYVVAYYAGGETQPKGLPFEVEPEIEPEPGAWRAQKIDTGGGPYFGGKVTNSTIIGRDWNFNIQAQDRSINVGGPVSNSALISGDRNRVEMGTGGNVSETSHIHIEGGVHANRDVIMGDQYNYGLRDERIAQIASPDEFRKALAEIQAQIAQLKQQPELSPYQKRNVVDAEKQMTAAAEEAQKPDAEGKKIKAILEDVKETFDSLSGGLEAAVRLGSTLAPIIGLAIKLFGG